jgi:hypothetical protein
MKRPPEEILHDLACELDRFHDKCETLFPAALDDLLNEAKAHKPTHIPADHAFSRNNNERKDDL